MKLSKKQDLAQKRRWRIKKKVFGTAERPRLSVRFSGKHIYAQCINDHEGKTLCYMSTLAKDLKGADVGANQESAVKVAKALAELAKKAGIQSVSFDRGGCRYHGKVKAFAEASRESGLNF